MEFCQVIDVVYLIVYVSPLVTGKDFVLQNLLFLMFFMPGQPRLSKKKKNVLYCWEREERMCLVFREVVPLCQLLTVLLLMEPFLS